MPIRIIILSILFLSAHLSLAQPSDSLALIDTFENYELSNSTSLKAYLDFFKKQEFNLDVQNRIIYATKGVEAAESLKKDSLYVLFHFELISIYGLILSETKTAMELANDIEDEIASINSPVYSASYNNFIGIIYYEEGDYVNALDYFIRAYRQMKKVHPHIARGGLYNVTDIYARLGDTKNTIKYANEALSLNEHLSERDANLNTAASNFRISKTYESENKSDTAFYFIKKALAAIDKIDNPKNGYNDLLTYCEVNLEALIYYATKGDEAKVAALLQKVDLCKGQIEPNYTISMLQYYLMINDLDKAAILLADTSAIGDDPWDIKEFTSHQSSYEEKIGNHKKALDFHKDYMDLTLELAKEKNNQYASFVNAQFDNVKQKEEIQRLQITEAAEKVKSKLYSIISLGLLILLAIALFTYRKIKQRNELLKVDLQNKALIEAQAKELKQMDVLKSRLFTNISHELRTPLTLITNPINRILKKVSLDRIDKEQLLLARKSSHQLLEISKQIMDLTKSEFGQLPVNLVRFNWHDFLDNLLPYYEHYAANNQQHFQHIETDTRNIEIQSDLVKLKVVIGNLLQNAFKFNALDGTVTFKSTDREQNLAFSISDTGRGIAKEDLPYVFDRYYQSKTNTAAEGGFGIGLALCKEYIQLLGGSIAIESGKEKGTTVLVSIPKIIPSSEVVAFHSFENELPNTLKVTATEDIVSLDKDVPQLLIVENNEELRSFYQTILEEDYDLVFAINGQDALKKLEKVSPDLVLSDWMMPIMNGLELVESIKDNEKFSHLPILMITARSLPTDHLKALQKGVDDYLLKPFDIDSLKLRIEHLLDFSKDRRENINVTPSSETVPPNSTILSKEDQKWITSFEEVIYTHIGDFDLTIASLTEEVQTSTAQINRNVKRILGMTPKQFINEIRFWEARKLLEEQDQVSVKSAAYSVGFKSVKNFSRNFKKRFGVYPSELLD